MAKFSERLSRKHCAFVEAQRVFGITFIELDETDPEVDGCVN